MVRPWRFTPCSDPCCVKSLCSVCHEDSGPDQIAIEVVGSQGGTHDGVYYLRNTTDYPIEGFPGVVNTLPNCVWAHDLEGTVDFCGALYGNVLVRYIIAVFSGDLIDGAVQVDFVDVSGTVLITRFNFFLHLTQYGEGWQYDCRGFVDELMTKGLPAACFNARITTDL